MFCHAHRAFVPDVGDVIPQTTLTEAVFERWTARHTDQPTPRNYAWDRCCRGQAFQNFPPLPPKEIKYTYNSGSILFLGLGLQERTAYQRYRKQATPQPNIEFHSMVQIYIKNLQREHTR